MFKLILLLSLFCISCEKYYVSVVRERVNRDSLASTFVGSPDPLQENPPIGQNLYINWRLPSNVNREELYLALSVIYRNYTKKTFYYTLDQRRRGVITYSLLNDDFFETGGLLTYKAEIITKDHEVLKEWTNSLWVDLIEM